MRILFRLLLLFFSLALLLKCVSASYGDRLPEFRECVEVNYISKPTNYSGRADLSLDLRTDELQ